jgi:hypothetical protein
VSEEGWQGRVFIELDSNHNINTIVQLSTFSILTLSVPPGHLYFGSHVEHSDVVPSLYFPAGHGEPTTPSVHLYPIGQVEQAEAPEPEMRPAAQS